ncbi:hypothetical protein DWG24_16530 [Dickeya zeae]|uniref:Endonuclease GajA/Old nuclease/RecF-like AAA domain-containing protein n=1 Tax=Dickeya zeae TaxID=204042 RepID=A0AAE7CZP5_9GAMM|nr:retron Eco8 family effector endonuclease [Dickeya zeae]QIZ52236.1 hypothetical protein DWG24_16530 [Dickeya zeae]
MTICSIRVKNLLSFDDILLKDFKDINCIIGRNNVGKSNLLKVIRYFYAKLNNQKVLPLDFHSNYDSFGEITFTYDTTRVKKIVSSHKNKGRFHKHIYNTLFSSSSIKMSFSEIIDNKKYDRASLFSVKLIICKDESVQWSIDDVKVRSLLATLYPFFYIETRHINLYDWSAIWKLISNLNSFNFDGVKQEELIEFLDSKISSRKGDYKNYIEKVVSIIDTKPYSYKEKVVNYIKIALKGDSFINGGEDLLTQSDGTNSNKFLETLLHLLISLTRTEFICPIIYIDEPEIGLHPKLGEIFISKIQKRYMQFKKTSDSKEPGKFSTPYPRIFFSTHSPSILKYTIKLFGNDQQVLHFSKRKDSSTSIRKVNSTYPDRRFLNIFSDNEARLFFSEYILFVEGATELEVFRNISILEFYPAFSNVDTYDANEVVLSNINPQYSQAAIPFTIVKDLDTLLDYDINKEILTFRPLFDELNKNRTSVFDFHTLAGSRIRKEIEYFSNLKESKKECKNEGLFFKKLNLSLLHNKINKLFSNKSRYFMSTTIEGALINENSLSYFFMWIESIIFNALFINNPNPERFINIMIKKYNLRTQSTQLFNKVFCSKKNNGSLDLKTEKMVHKIKLAFIIGLKKKIHADFNDKEIVLSLRLAFGGKSETIYTLDRLRKSNVAPVFRAKIKSYKENELAFLEPMMSKTSGWVTDFLDYTLSKIKDEELGDHANIKAKLSFIFPEIISIIELASSSIEAEGLSLPDKVFVTSSLSKN